jgi:hypothetical protein
VRLGCLKRDTPARWKGGRELRFAKRFCHGPEGKPLGFPCEREVIERAIPIHSDAVSLAYPTWRVMDSQCAQAQRALPCRSVSVVGNKTLHIVHARIYATREEETFKARLNGGKVPL